MDFLFLVQQTSYVLIVIYFYFAKVDRWVLEQLVLTLAFSVFNSFLFSVHFCNPNRETKSDKNYPKVH